MTCRHPPERLFTGFVRNPFTGEQEISEDGMWVACCACGQLLQSARLYDRLADELMRQGETR